MQQRRGYQPECDRPKGQEEEGWQGVRTREVLFESCRECGSARKRGVDSHVSGRGCGSQKAAQSGKVKKSSAVLLFQDCQVRQGCRAIMQWRKKGMHSTMRATRTSATDSKVEAPSKGL